jgi:hypothetical protein
LALVRLVFATSHRVRRLMWRHLDISLTSFGRWNRVIVCVHRFDSRHDGITFDQAELWIKQGKHSDSTLQLADHCLIGSIALWVLNKDAIRPLYLDSVSKHFGEALVRCRIPTDFNVGTNASGGNRGQLIRPICQKDPAYR